MASPRGDRGGKAQDGEVREAAAIIAGTLPVRPQRVPHLGPELARTVGPREVEPVILSLPLLDDECQLLELRP